MKKAILLLPILLLVVVIGSSLIRSRRPAAPAADRPRPCVSQESRTPAEPDPPPSPLHNVPRPVPREPENVSMSPEERGRSFSRVAMGNRISAYVSAALSGDETTRTAILGSLKSAPTGSREVVVARLAGSPSPRQAEVLRDLLAQLK